MSEGTGRKASIPFEKYHGTGNDFVVIDARERVPNRAKLAARACDREAGIGADGVLFLALEPDYRPPRVVMTLVQPDGGTAPMCGNGARCATAWAIERTGAECVMVDTQAGSRRGERVDDGFGVEMGRPSFAPADVPLDADEPIVEQTVAELTVTAVNTGVGHAVAFVDDVDAVDLGTVAPPVRHADVFPRGTNVTLASPTDDGAGFHQRTFERGVEGETDACGTGAVAIVAAARRLGHTDAATVPVRPPGGELRVTVTDDGRTRLAGRVERAFDGRVTVDGSPVTEP